MTLTNLLAQISLLKLLKASGLPRHQKDMPMLKQLQKSLKKRRSLSLSFFLWLLLYVPVNIHIFNLTSVLDRTCLKRVEHGSIQ